MRKITDSDIDRLRKEVGLPKIEPKYRKCLRCDKKFVSYNYEVRLCERCRKRLYEEEADIFKQGRERKKHKNYR